MALRNVFYQDGPPQGEYRFFQVSFVVEDIVAAAQRWGRVFGVGPFFVMPRRRLDCWYRGTTGTLEIQVALAQSGPAQIELVQQFNDVPSVYRDVYAAGQGGFHHICTITDRYEETLERYVRLGFPIGSKIESPVRAAYVDTREGFGFFSEVVERTAAHTAAMGDIAAASEGWDGSDPVRMTARAGYEVSPGQ